MSDAGFPSEELPSPVDSNRPNAARVYDWMLGGSHNFAVDRELARRMIEESGSSPTVPRLNRSFLRRAVRFLVARGIDQFLDLGSGIPTVGNVHEIAQAANPEARVVYVDNEPVAVSHAQHMLRDNPRAAMVYADMRDVDRIMRHPDTLRLLDFDRPMAVLMVAVLHFLPDEDRPAEIVARYRDTVVPGSYFALSHTASDGSDDVRRAVAWFARTPTPMTPRTRAEFTAMLAGLELVPPGVTWTTQWHPDGSDPELPSPEHAGVHVAVGRVPGATAS